MNSLAFIFLPLFDYSFLLFLPILFAVAMVEIYEHFYEGPPKYTKNKDAEGQEWEIIGVNNQGNIWKLWHDNEKNRHSSLRFYPGCSTAGNGIFKHYGGKYDIHNHTINITMAGAPYLTIFVKKSEKHFVSTTITDSEGNIDEVDFIY